MSSRVAESRSARHTNAAIAEPPEPDATAISDLSPAVPGTHCRDYQEQNPMSAIAAINRPPGKAWYFLQLAPVRIVVAALSVAGIIAAVQLCARAAHIKLKSTPGVIFGLFLIVVMCAAYSGYARLVERRKVVELAPGRALAEFASGVLVGAALFVATAAILGLLGVWQFDGANAWTALIYPLSIALGAAFFEEIFFRGILFRIAEESLGSWLALALSAAVFGLVHGFNPAASALSILAICLESGVLLAAAYMYSRRLWLPIGLHFAWNFTESGVFGASTSGSEAQGLLVSRLSGPELLTGGAFGPEASIVAVLVCLGASIGLLVLAGRKNHIVAPVWRRG
jgi:membrane protease YdiL (CAAX protease family)